MEVTSPADPWIIPSMIRSSSYFPGISIPEAFANESKCLAGVLLSLDSCFSDPCAVLYCDIQNLVVHCYMNQQEQVVHLRNHSILDGL